MAYEKTLSKIETLYKENLLAHGVSSSSVGWPKEADQQLRFEKLTSLIMPSNDPVTINDYGCGYGAHLEFLVKKYGLNVTAYNGYDISVDMLKEARNNLEWFDGKLSLIDKSDIQTEADFTFVSGTFNVRFEATDAEWKTFIKEKLSEIAEHSARGFAFNLLSTYVDWKEPNLFYGDPLFWFDFCKNNFSRHVSLIHDYPLYEWTIVVKS